MADPQRLNLSLNEVEALAKKATRGAGYPWGIAEEAAKATRWLVENGLDACAELAGLLEVFDGADPADWRPTMEGNTWSAPLGRLCPLIAGASVSDFAYRLPEEAVILEEVVRPGLLVPFAGYAAQYLGQPVTMTWAEGSAVTDGTGLVWSGAAVAQAKRVEIAVGGVCDQPSVGCDRASPSPRDLNSLERFAHRTYAPATEASRLKGAGAGTSDND